MANNGKNTVQKGRINYIEPNNIVSANKGGRDNEIWAMEEYNISVDLQVITPLRVNTVSLSGNDDKISIMAMNNKNPIGRYVSFLQGSKLDRNNNGSLTDKYINSTYTEIKNGEVSSTENLGITRIDVRFDEQFYPQVQITFVDVRGFSLMMPSEVAEYENKNFDNLFSALFHYPYPRFLLTLKGQYGGKVTLQLAVSEFYTSFNQDTGNFEITVDFIGYMYGLYSDIPMNLLIAAPYYNCDDTNSKYKSWEEQVTKTFNFDNGQPIMTFVEYLGVVYNVNKKMANGELSEIAHKLSELEEKLDLANEVMKAHQIIVEKAYERENEVQAFIGDSYSVFLIEGRKDENFLLKQKNDLIAKLAYLENQIYAFNSKSEGNKIEGIKTSLEDYSLTQFTSNNFFNTSGLTVLSKNGRTTLGKSLNDIGDERLKDAIAQNTISGSTMYYFIYNYKPFTDIIDKTVEQCQKYADNYEAENETKLKEQMQKALTDALGFAPTVENIYRMIFAHLDCFIHEFYDECLGAILTSDGEKSKRGIEILSNYHNDLLDNNGYDHIPPFPNVFRKEYDSNNHKYNELLWIGEEEDFKNFKEVEFINNLFDGVIAVKKTTNETFRKEQAEAEAGEYNYDWCPTGVLDYAHEVNPYKEMNEAMVTKPFDSVGCTGYLSTFARKRIEGAFATCNGGDIKTDGIAIAKLEAYNFYKANPTMPPYLAQYFQGGKTNVSELKKVGENFLKNSGKNFFQGISPYFKTLENNGKEACIFVTSGNSIAGAASENVYDFVDVLYDVDRIKNFIQAWNTPPQLPENVTFEEFKGRPLVSGEGPIKGYLYEQPDAAQYGDIVYNSVKLTRVYTLEEFNKKEEKYLDPESYNNKVTEAGKNTDINAPKPLYRVPYLYISNGASREIVNKGKDREETALKIVAAIGTGKDNDISQCFVNENSFISFNSIESILWLCGREKAVIEGKGELIDNNFKTAFKDPGLKFNNSNYKFYQTLAGIWDEYLKRNEGGPLGRIIDLLNQSHLEQDGRYSAKLSQAIISFITTNAFFVRSSFVRDVSQENIDGMIGAFWTALGHLYGADRGSEENNTEEVGYKDITNSHRLALYETLKKIYDKWLSGYDKNEFTLREYNESRNRMKDRFLSTESYYLGKDSEFDNFIYIDSFYRDISNKYFINPRVIYDQLKNHLEADLNFSVYEFMYNVAQENKLLFVALPVYNNIYSPSHLEDIFKPHFYYNKTNSTTLGVGTTYVIMYPHEVSHFANDEAMMHYTGYRDDGFDLADTNGNVLPTAVELFKTDENGLAYSVPAFGVTYAKQNQSYFKRINIEMNNPRVTDFSIANTFELGNMDEFGGAVNVQMVGQDLYSVFSNRSYTCSVDMMGCMNIMPMMYFQLNNIPMIKGAYIITNVHHTFTYGNATTTFNGVRVSKNTIPYNKDIFNFRVFKQLVQNMGNKLYITSGSNASYDSYGGGYAIESSTNLGKITVDPGIRYKAKEDEYHLVYYKYKKDNLQWYGVIFEASTKDKLCDTWSSIKDDNIKGYNVYTLFCNETPKTEWELNSNHKYMVDYSLKAGFGAIARILRSNLIHCGSHGHDPWSLGCVITTINPNGEKKEIPHSAKNLNSSVSWQAFKNVYNKIGNARRNKKKVVLEVIEKRD